MAAKKNKKKSGAGIKTILLASYLVLGLSSIVNKTPVYDETLHLADGIAYHRFHNFRFGIEHPPMARYLAGFACYFSKNTLPPKDELIRSDDEMRTPGWSPRKDFEFADKFLFRMKNRTGLILFLGRFFILLLGIPAGLVLYKWSAGLYGAKAGILTLALFCLSPNVLAHARLATTDFASVAFTICAAWFLWEFMLEPDMKHMLPSAVLWGLALSSKHTALFYFPAFQLTALALCRNRKKFVLYGILQIPVIIFLINLSYLFTEPVSGNFFSGTELSFFPAFPRALFIFFSKILLLPETYLKGIAYSFFHSRRGHSAFLLGMHSIKGWRYYFPAALAIKSTLTSVFLTVLSLLTFRKKKFSRNEIYFIVPGVLFLIFMMKSDLNIGIRHVLLLYPLLFLFSGRAALLKPKAVIFFILFAAFENLLIWPNYISQINFLLGGANRGYRYIGDSNLDWGQDLGKLTSWWKKNGRPALTLSYFGTGEPAYFGLKYQGCLMSGTVKPFGETANPAKSSREFFAASVTNLQGIYLPRRDLFYYFLKKKPYARAGKSIYIYDVTNDAYAHLIFGSIYKAQGKLKLSETEFSKFKRFHPSPQAAP